MNLICSDLEGVWTPEVWLNVAQKTGIEELRLTTREVRDYNELMTHRIKVLAREGLRLIDIQEIISTILPHEGAVETLNRIRSQVPLILVSDTFSEFAAPLMEKLGYPTLLCHSLEIDNQGFVTGYRLRQKDPKKMTVKALQDLNYHILAIGDSYNDISMLQAADEAILFNPPKTVANEFPEFPAVANYEELMTLLRQKIGLK